MEQIANNGYEDMIKRQVDLLIPDFHDLETAEEVAEDVWKVVADEDKDRMCYATGKVAKQLYEKRQELGDEAFQKFMKDALMPQ